MNLHVSIINNTYAILLEEGVPALLEEFRLLCYIVPYRCEDNRERERVKAEGS
jgi:hypothetical protein